MRLVESVGMSFLGKRLDDLHDRSEARIIKISIDFIFKYIKKGDKSPRFQITCSVVHLNLIRYNGPFSIRLHRY
jgi:hypothetical protein